MNSYIFLGSSKFHNDCSKQNSIFATICGRRSVNIRTTVKRGLIFSSFLFFLLAYKFAFYAYNIFNNIIILNYFLTLRIFLFACKIFFYLKIFIWWLFQLSQLSIQSFKLLKLSKILFNFAIFENDSIVWKTSWAEKIF